jgi:hypothetical protein
MLNRIEPVAVTRGQTVEILISGDQNFSGASSLLTEPNGLIGEIIGEVKNDRAPSRGRRKGNRKPRVSIKGKLTVAPDAPLGPREIRVGTPQGVSSVGLVVVVDAPVVSEADDRSNNQPVGAEELSMPSVIAGKIGIAEDVDWYTFEGKAGREVVFEVWANRLENKIHDLQTHFDPILSIHDAQGRELQAADNHFYADPLLIFRPPADGRYFLQIRDTTYAGNPSWIYALQATSGPAITATLPMAVNPGKVANLRAVGVNFDAGQPITLDVPKESQPGIHFFDLATTRGKALPFPLLVTPLPVVPERDDAGATFDKAQEIGFPSAVSGRLGESGDLDVYRFPARKGTIYSFEVMARRLYAECDPVVSLVNGEGKSLVETDDTPEYGKDSRFEWTAPSDGPFALKITDLHSRGGDRSSYVILAEEAKPDFELACDPDKLNVGPGSRVPLFARITRKNGYKGPVTLAWENLPEGVSASPLTIPPSMTEGVVVVSAAPDAAAGARLIRVVGKGDGGLIRTATPRQEIYLPGGGRRTLPMETMAMAVTDPSDIVVNVTKNRLELSPGDTAPLEVEIKRHEPFAGSVNLAIVLQHLGGIHGNPLPKGVTLQEAGSKTLLGPAETRGKLILKVAPDAPPCQDVPIAVMGHVSINFVVKTAYCGEPVRITVKPKGGH